MSTNPSVKFRPSLSAAQISHLIMLLESPHAGSNELGKEILKALRVFKLKADHGIVSPSHITTPKQSIESSLGFDDPFTSPNTTEDNDAFNKLLLDNWNNNRNVLTQAQIERVQMYRYTNDLMTPEEEQEYEQQANQSV